MIIILQFTLFVKNLMCGQELTGGLCKHAPTREGLCTYHYNVKNKNKITLNIVFPPGFKTMQCSSKKHKLNSVYDRYKVPVSMFKKSNPHKLFKTCSDCRKYSCKMRKNQTNKIKILLDKNECSKFKVCQSLVHNEKNCTYQREKVPISMFLDDNDNLTKYCLECRNYISKSVKKCIIGKKEIVKNEGGFFCERCYQIKPKYEQGINLNGSLSTSCVTCKKYGEKYSIIRNIYLRKCYKQLQFEYIFKFGTSCQKCKSIYIKSSEGTKHAIELPTYVKEGNHFIDYEGVTYHTRDFLEKFKESLELRVIDFDHLTREEQITRKILLTGQYYIGKINSVSQMGSDKLMRKEAKKCQHLCSKCHTSMTISREKNLFHKRTIEGHKKSDYVNSLKLKNGCSVCGFSDKNLLRFLDLDHLDPENKVVNVSIMVIRKEYSLKDVVEECKKCRVLCKHCHRIHTSEQIKQGILVSQKKKWKKL